MIAELLKDEYFSIEEMAKTLRISVATMRRRIGRGTEHPPYQKIDGEILFPRAHFAEWVRTRPIVWEVRRVG